MIDVLINDEGGITICHDERWLDAAESVAVTMSSGEIAVTCGDGGRSIGTLAGKMRQKLKCCGPTASIVRMSGYAIASTAEVPFSLR